MAIKATEDSTTPLEIPVCELSARLALRHAGMRLARNGDFYRILYKNQVLLAWSECGTENLGLEEIVRFANRSLVR